MYTCMCVWMCVVAQRKGRIIGIGNTMAAPKGHKIGQEGRFLGVISQAYITEVPESAPEMPVIFISHLLAHLEYQHC